jgi:hypothetical protein
LAEVKKEEEKKEAVEEIVGDMIYTLIPRVMAGIAPISKDKQSAQRYKFRGIDDVYQAVNPILVAHQVFVVPEVLTTRREDHATKAGGALYFTFLTVKYTFFAPDGSSVFAVVTGEGADSSDKGANKAMSSAYKMAMFQVFCIPTEAGSVDPETDDNQTTGRNNTSTPPPGSPPTPPTDSPLTQKDFARIFAGMNVKSLKKEDIYKRFGISSGKELKQSQMPEILKWIKDTPFGNPKQKEEQQQELGAKSYPDDCTENAEQCPHSEFHAGDPAGMVAVCTSTGEVCPFWKENK